MLSSFGAGILSRTGRYKRLTLAFASLFLGCGDPANPVEIIPPPPVLVPTLEGFVTRLRSDVPIVGAKVSVGDRTTVTNNEGIFRFTGLDSGMVMVRIEAKGYEPVEDTVLVPRGIALRVFPLTPIEVFEFDEFAVFIPDSSRATAAILLALGGPDTRGFATGKPFGAPLPAVEASLQLLGEEFRRMAVTHGLIVVGTSRAAMENNPESDELILSAIRKAGELSNGGRLDYLPLLIYGISGGGPEAIGFASRNPDAVVGTFLKVPASVTTLTNPDALAVPTYVVLAELDAFVDNTALRAAFYKNRSAGGLWALAEERGVPHHPSRQLIEQSRSIG